MKGDLKIYNIDDNYINYLRKFEPKVFDPKLIVRNHNRKYVGTVLNVNDLKYYIPFSSPKPSDFKEDGISIRKSIIPIIRMTNKSKTELKGTLKLSNMIPVPDRCIEIYNIGKEKDSKYRDLLLEQAEFIRNNTNLIRNNASVIYTQKNNNYNIGYIRNCVNFKLLEQKCLEYEIYLKSIEEVAFTEEIEIEDDYEDNWDLEL